MKLLTILVMSTIWLPGCTSWGQRQISVERDSDSWSVIAASGSNISDGFAGDLTIIENGTMFYFSLKGRGGAVDSSKGHEATVDMMDKVSKRVIEGAKLGASGGASGAMRGFVRE